jgi:hypothetical protein
MSDLEKFVQLYKDFGIECQVNVKDNKQIIYLNGGSGYGTGYKDTDSDKFHGYAGFYSDVEFDMSGKFIMQGFWE